MDKISAAITAIGSYVPEGVLTNFKLENMVDTTDDWIVSRTGIRERRILQEQGLGSSHMGIKAAEDLIERRGLDPKEIDLVILATVTPDMPVAISATHIASSIGAVNAFSFDLLAACSGFLYGMSIASSYVMSGRYKKVLLIGADKMSSVVDYEDRTTCIIFGDGAGAALFEPNYDGLGFQNEILRGDSIGRKHLRIDAGGSVMPASEKTVLNRRHYVYQEGKVVFRYAVSNMSETLSELMKKNDITQDDINWLVPHQANKRIIDSTANSIGLDPYKVLCNIEKYGNTTAATLPLLLTDYENQFKKGDDMLFVTFGGGFTWGAIYYKWAY